MKELNLGAIFSNHYKKVQTKKWIMTKKCKSFNFAKVTASSIPMWSPTIVLTALDTF